MEIIIRPEDIVFSCRRKKQRSRTGNGLIFLLNEVYCTLLNVKSICI